MGEPSGEVTPRRAQTAPESIQAVDDFQAVMREIRDILLPEVVRSNQTRGKLLKGSAGYHLRLTN
jgi:amphiphysin